MESIDILTALFGSQAKVKLLRMFLFNQGSSFFLAEIVDRTKCPSGKVRKELNALIKADIIKRREISKDVQAFRGQKKFIKKMKGSGYTLNDRFPYLEPLKNLLTVSSVHADESLAKRFTNVGRVKLFIASGVFIQNWDSRVDLLIVGDELDLHRIESAIEGIEAEIGKEISYSAFETSDFEYRYGIHDRLIRDIIDYQHVTLIDRLGIEPQ